VADQKPLLEIVVNYGDNEFQTHSGNSTELTPKLVENMFAIMHDRIDAHLGFEPKWKRDFTKKHGVSPDKYGEAIQNAG
jgi:hypothetical protein